MPPPWSRGRGDAASAGKALYGAVWVLDTRRLDGGTRAVYGEGRCFEPRYTAGTRSGADGKSASQASPRALFSGVTSRKVQINLHIKR